MTAHRIYSRASSARKKVIRLTHTKRSWTVILLPALLAITASITFLWTHKGKHSAELPQPSIASVTQAQSAAHPRSPINRHP
jgi:hypothetical protein